MVCYEAARGETKDFRCPTTDGQYFNRASTRIVMKAYGKPINFFTSTLQVLSAIRDAIAGHQRIVGGDVRIIHRDISHNNILLCEPGTSEGQRGVLIDFDLAFRAVGETGKVVGDYEIGTRVFQSLSVLEGFYLGSRAAEHDYLADLESFFYVLCYIFLLHLPNGERLPKHSPGPSLVSSWGDEDAERAFMAKQAIFDLGAGTMSSFQHIEANWGLTCLELYTGVRQWILRLRREKTILVHKSVGQPTFDPLAPLHAHRDEHYRAFLELFDHAIDAIGSPLTSPDRHFKATTSISQHRSNTAISTKDVSEESTRLLIVDDGGPSSLHHVSPGLPGSLRRGPPTRERQSEGDVDPNSPHVKARRIKAATATEPSRRFNERSAGCRTRSKNTVKPLGMSEPRL
ncbi:hypothetical protein NMY22_g1427 [Coprinellus aureogranulatus]|nr:hypothetical protein NMY22_g1427 [Coprinellus aureogranulatus]